MKRILAATVIVSFGSFSVVGCNDASKSSTKQVTKIATPGGTTTITTEQDVKKSGEHPPGTTP